MVTIKRIPERVAKLPDRVKPLPKAALPFYHSAEWLAKRRKLIAERGAWCETCGKGGRLILDHIVEIKDGGAMLDDDNLKVLCHLCHQRKTAQEQARRSGRG
jgi:5-methylcytosine-specific restriction endonuclease McrA